MDALKIMTEGMVKEEQPVLNIGDTVRESRSFAPVKSAERNCTTCVTALVRLPKSRVLSDQDPIQVNIRRRPFEVSFFFYFIYSGYQGDFLVEYHG